MMKQSHEKDEQQRASAAEELQRKSPSELTDAELEQLCAQVETIIDKLSLMGQQCLTEEQQRKRRTKLQQALDVAEVLELEQMVRLVHNVQSRVGYRVALSQRKRINHRQKERSSDES